MSARSRLRTAVLPALVLAVMAGTSGEPAHAAAADVLVQGESLARPAGATIVSNSTASGGKALFLTTTGTATGNVTTAATTGRIVVRAYGVQCAGPPRVTVKVDGRGALVSFVPSTSWTDYLADVSVPAGSHTLAVSYTNDDATSTCNRGLQVDSVKLVNAANVTTPFRSPPLLGAAVRWKNLSTDANYQRTVIGNFDSITPESEMKMRNLEPQRGVFSFGTADALVNWAQTNGKAIRGHTLVWAPALPAWLTGGTWTTAQLNSILQQYITTVVSRYRGRVPVWDVVNEAIDDSGNYVHNYLYDKLGPSYIENAFRWAHAADPQAKLFYNDYSAEGTNAKSNAIYSMLSDFKARGVPVNGFGMQAHTGTTIATQGADMTANMQRFAALGLDVEVTEMDVWTSPTAGTTADKLAAQAAVYRTYATSCRQVPACKRFTTWGVYDGLTWLGSSEMPLLFDLSYHGKPAFAAVGQAFAASSP